MRLFLRKYCRKDEDYHEWHSATGPQIKLTKLKNTTDRNLLQLIKLNYVCFSFVKNTKHVSTKTFTPLMKTTLRHVGLPIYFSIWAVSKNCWKFESGLIINRQEQKSNIFNNVSGKKTDDIKISSKYVCRSRRKTEWQIKRSLYALREENCNTPPWDRYDHSKYLPPGQPQTNHWVERLEFTQSRSSHVQDKA